MEPSDSNYPLFVPPLDLSRKLPRDWTEAEARQYLVWLTTIMDDRIAQVLRFLGEEDSSDIDMLLRRVGRKAMWVFHKPEFTFQRIKGATGLTECGYSLAADLGLLVARSLINANDAVRWKVLRKPKSELSYNQPVLAGFGSQYLDPVRGSVAETLKSIRAGDGEGGWHRIFDHWLKRASASAPRS